MAARAFDFNGLSDGDLVTVAGSVWEGITAAQRPAVVSNEVTCNASSTTAGGARILTTDTTFSGEDQFAQLELVVHEDFEGAMPAVQADTSGNCYYASIRANTAVRIRKLTAGVVSTLTGDLTPASGFVATDTLRVRVQRDVPSAGTSTITVYRNGVSFGSITDSSQHAAGQPGIISQNANGDASTSRWDNFYAEDENGAAAGSVVPLLHHLQTLQKR